MTAKRVRISLQGIVQGVGFRPHAYRLARRLRLSGLVQNTPDGVVIEVEGEDADRFLEQLQKRLPPLCRIDRVRTLEVPPRGSSGFHIVGSCRDGLVDSPISPDVALCQRCRREFFDPANRRHRYPFITCTDCGPRYTIILGIPYDRPYTTMSRFEMCPSCRREYEDPSSRRYHAQPISCYDCGPSLTWTTRGREVRTRQLERAVRMLAAGKVVAVKGLGGYHLACLASSSAAVRRLRRIKGREAKPFALMGTMEMIRRECRLTRLEQKWLRSPAAPILLLERKRGGRVADEVAADLSRLGFMLPYTGLHLRLIEEVGEPLVMTSANRADEPIVHADAAEPLLGMADGVLAHDRPIGAFADDSVLQARGRIVQVIRRSRGFVPFDLQLDLSVKESVLAVGPMLKGTFTLLKGSRALLSPYIATLESRQSLEAELALIRHFMKVFAIEPKRVAVDRHPLYPSRTLADEFPGCPRIEVQHHRAHVAALLAEARWPGAIIGVAMDGTGYGDDGAVWGGEFFVGDLRGLERVGHLRYQFLPGGDAAVREPWRYALAILDSLPGGSDLAPTFAARYGKTGLAQLEAISRALGGVPTSSCGRLFDAAAVLLGVGDRNLYDGDLPSRLQALAESARGSRREYDWSVEGEGQQLILDLRPLFLGMIEDRVSPPERAAAFHHTLAGAIADMAERLRERLGHEVVGLCGGVFQNLLLLERTVFRLQQKGFRVLLHRQVPCNDGSISLGQAVLASQASEQET